MPTDRELQRMRASFADAMPSVALFKRRENTTNAIGGREGTLDTVSGMTAVPCHVHPVTSRGTDEGDSGAGRMGSNERYRIMFAFGTDARVSDQVTVDGRVYELETVDTDRSAALEVEAYAMRSS